jgi:hypothetical protein
MKKNLHNWIPAYAGMTSNNRSMMTGIRPLALIICLFLSACGFTPMLAHDDKIESGSRLAVASTSKDGSSYTVQMMRQRLKNILSGLNLDSTYKTYVRLSEESGNLAYATDATATRSMMRMTAQIVISCEGRTIYETKCASVTSYSQNSNDEFANQSASEGARERLIESLSIDISREMHGFVKTHPPHGKNV